MADYPNLDAQQRMAADRPQTSGASHEAADAIGADIDGHLDPQLLAELHEAMLSPNAKAGRTAVRRAVVAGARSQDIADFYIPALARAYGEMWCEDELTFGEVTIAVSRLQTTLRDLEADWPSEDGYGNSLATLLLIIPQDVFHTLGAFVIGGQLRRKGISVKMVLGGTSKTITEELSCAEFDAIFVSASQCDTFGSLRAIIDVVQAVTEATPPIVVGGSILEVETAMTVKTKTGADYATARIEEALGFCGLLPTMQDDTPTMCRG